MVRVLRFVSMLILLPACGGRALHDGGGGSTGGTTSSTGGSTSSTGGGSGVGGTPDWGACTAADECILAPVGPCGVGCEPVELARFIPINAANAEAYQRSKPLVPCLIGDCRPIENAAKQTQNYFALCVSGHCQASDVRESELSACADDTDCALRFGVACCACGSEPLVAVASRANVETTFCAPQAACTAECVPPEFPRFVAAWCTRGHCVVHYPP